MRRTSSEALELNGGVGTASQSGQDRFVMKPLTAGGRVLARDLHHDLRAGKLEWNIEDLANIAKNFTPPDAI